MSNILLVFVFGSFHISLVSLQHAMVRLQDANGKDGLQIWKVAGNMWPGMV